MFVADLTRADAPALVMTTECELVMKSGAEGALMTAIINDLKVRGPLGSVCQCDDHTRSIRLEATLVLSGF